jgi:hypothetical protein
MEKQQLINRLVNRKLASTGKNKAFCICMAHRVCFGQPAGQPTAKK